MSGWGAVGKAKNMEDYICCSLVPQWGMSRHDPDDKVLIQLQPRLLWREGTLFSPNWSSYNYITLQKLLSNNTAESFDSMFDNPTTAFPSPHSVEILVPNGIGVSEFLPLMFFHSIESKEHALTELKDTILPDGKTVAETFRFIDSPHQFRGNY